MQDPCKPYAVPVSRNYDVTLKPGGAPYTQSENISQALKPDDVDRFTFTLGLDRTADPEKWYVPRMTVALVYDEDNKSMSTNDLLFVKRSPHTIMACYLNSDYARDMLRVNKAVVEEIRQTEGIKSPQLEKLIRDISEATIEN